MSRGSMWRGKQGQPALISMRLMPRARFSFPKTRDLHSEMHVTKYAERLVVVELSLSILIRKTANYGA